MTPEQLYGVVNLLVLPGWLLLVFAPRAAWTRRLVHSGVYSALFALAYVGFITMAWPVSLDYGSLASVSTLFANPWVLLAGWVHYLAFDLLVAAWMVRDGQGRGIAHGWILPFLFLTFYAGPLGLGAYLLARLVLPSRAAAA